ncbi:MAG: hypothetical protein WC332_00910 [Clostridia bacterium]|jgi:hypothetical protein
MIFLWNPTNEDMPFSYAGLSYTLLAGKRMKVDEAMGKHVLNNLTARGMTKLIFDDDGKSIEEDAIAKDAIERNREFKIKQIVTYNERNERRKASGQPYDVPSKIIKQYAIELGIELLQPYSLAEGEKGQIGKLSRENEELKTQMAALLNQMQEVMATVAKGGQQEPVNQKKNNSAEELIACGICGEMVRANRMKSHINFKHNPIKDFKDDTKPVPV